MGALLVFTITSALWLMMFACGDSNFTSTPANYSHPDKDMYVIHATVYQVGILTNKTDMTDGFNHTGNLESLTFFHTNGSKVDLSAIPEPLITNVTAQSMVAVAPIGNGQQASVPSWDTLGKLVIHQPQESLSEVPDKDKTSAKDKENTATRHKRSINNFYLRMFKRDAENAPVKVVQGAAVIPVEAGVSSISLPPLLALNNYSKIPVPIPNTSVVRYARVNTIVQKP